jgi:hypothetical protein
MMVQGTVLPSTKDDVLKYLVLNWQHWNELLTMQGVLHDHGIADDNISFIRCHLQCLV